MARLVAARLLELKGSLDRWVRAAVDSIEAYKLPGRFHKDPADRILVSTARMNDLTLVTADERMLAYRAVRTLDARREAGVVLKWRRKSVVM